MAMIIRWENPPLYQSTEGSGRKSSNDYEKLAEELKKRPGQYAVIQENNIPVRKKLAYAIKYGELKAFRPAGDFDACTFNIKGVKTVFAAYLGNGIHD